MEGWIGCEGDKIPRLRCAPLGMTFGWDEEKMGPRIREDTREGEKMGPRIREDNGWGDLHETNWWRASGGTGAHEGRPYGRLVGRGGLATTARFLSYAALRAE